MDDYFGQPMYCQQDRTTIDGQWTEEELNGDIYDEVVKYYATNNVKENYANRAMTDKDLIKPQYMVEKICEENDLVEVYNTQYDKRRSENKFGICYFDEWLNKMICKLLKENLIS